MRNKNEWLWPCIECGRRFSIQNELRDHINAEHHFECAFCGWIFKKEQRLRQHYEDTHSKDMESELKPLAWHDVTCSIQLRMSGENHSDISNRIHGYLNTLFTDVDVRSITIEKGK